MRIASSPLTRTARKLNNLLRIKEDVARPSSERRILERLTNFVIIDIPGDKYPSLDIQNHIKALETTLHGICSDANLKVSDIDVLVSVYSDAIIEEVYAVALSLDGGSCDASCEVPYIEVLRSAGVRHGRAIRSRWRARAEGPLRDGVGSA